MDKEIQQVDRTNRKRYVSRATGRTIKKMLAHLREIGYHDYELVAMDWNRFLDQGAEEADLRIFAVRNKFLKFDPNPAEIRVGENLKMVNDSKYGVTAYFLDGIFTEYDAGPEDGWICIEFAAGQERTIKVKDPIEEPAKADHKQNGYVEVLLSGDGGTSGSPKGNITPPP